MTGNDLRIIANKAKDGPLTSAGISAILDAADQLDALRAALAISEQSKRMAIEAVARDGR